MSYVENPSNTDEHKKIGDQSASLSIPPTEEEVKNSLITAFVQKVMTDIEEQGFTVLSRTHGTNGYVTEATNSSVIYFNGDKQYSIYLTAIKDMPGMPYPHVSRMKLSIDAQDVVDLTKLSEGERRKGSINKETYPRTPEDNPDTTPLRTETGSIYFSKAIKHAADSQVGPKRATTEITELSTADTNSFLRELLNSQVDVNATQNAFDQTKVRKTDNFREILSIHWNRERPGQLFEVFSN